METSNTLKSYIDELSSNSPTPGGGNVAALCGVLASALGEMVCGLTIGKKKYHEFEAQAIELKDKLSLIKEEFIELSKRDNEAFNKVMSAFKLPKNSDDEKTKRRDAIDKATLDAAIVPSDVIIKCNELLPILETIAKKGNQNSVSDAGVAISLTAAAAQGAYLNVVINCIGLLNQIAANEFLIKTEILYNEIKEKSNHLISELIKRMRNQ